MTRSEHALIHSKLPNVNMITFLKIISLEPSILEELHTIYLEQVEQGKYEATPGSAMSLIKKYRVVENEKKRD